jgi:hypothetical protein
MQQHLNSLLTYSCRHGQHISSISIDDTPSVPMDKSLTSQISQTQSDPVRLCIHELPSSLQLNSLRLVSVGVQLFPAAGMRGVLQTLTSLTQLQLVRCDLLESSDPDGDCTSTAALQQLTKLQHLELQGVYSSRTRGLTKAQRERLKAMLQLRGLTHLHLSGFACAVQPSDLQDTPQLTNLRSLELQWNTSLYAAAGKILLGAQQLTRLDLSMGSDVWAGCTGLWYGQKCVLSSMPQLQHLTAEACASGEPAAVTEFLQELGSLTQLTHLQLVYSLVPCALSAADYTALTASSKLHTLRLEECCLPPGIWQHMSSAGRRLPHLETLSISGYSYEYDTHRYALDAADIAALVGCCPNLRRLALPELYKGGESAEALRPLRSLTSLQKLTVQHPTESITDAALQVLAELTGLTALSLGGGEPWGSSTMVTATGLLHLTSLRQIMDARLRVELQDYSLWCSYWSQVRPGGDTSIFSLEVLLTGWGWYLQHCQ